MKKRNPIVKIKEGSGDGPLIHLEPGAWAQRPAPIQPGDDNTKTEKNLRIPRTLAAVARLPYKECEAGPGDSITPRAASHSHCPAHCLSSMAKQTRYWCFTINNPTEEDASGLADGLYDYIVCGRETGKDGTPHIQGFIVMKKIQRLTAMKKILPRSHLEPMRGTPKEASDYCKKDGDYLEEGTLPEPPHKLGGEATKSKYTHALECAKSGMTSS